ncbi:endothelial differentiation-related factor 1 homolog isoform X1 [Chanodichthys erythropterus]|uniref:endothelial differentiation-related factor 1 homolog isoform X1 n=1 Tax=Chanodichthys erythropterus TaxID=933992 RepID=UPI00351EDA57
MAESDWDTVTVLRKKGSAAQSKSKQAIISAQRKGEEVETSKKWAAGQNKQHVVTKNTAKLDRETEELSHQRVPLEVGKVIQQGRQNKGLTQKDLATKINEKPQIIAEYESGKAIPNNQVMGKIERAIGAPTILRTGRVSIVNNIFAADTDSNTSLLINQNFQMVSFIFSLPVTFIIITFAGALRQALCACLST